VIAPPQRKQVIGTFSFRLWQDLQYALSPCLFSPHPSVLQSIKPFSAMKHSEQLSLLLDRETPHLQIAASKTYSFLMSAVAHDRQCVVGNFPLHAGHFGMDPGAGTTNVDEAKIPHSTHKGWSAFFGWGITRNGFLMAFRASATCSSSGHVASAAVDKGLTPTVILPMRMSIRVALSICGCQGGAPGITCATAPTHGGAVCGACPLCPVKSGNKEGGVASD
jgi:hypothetical protein